MLTAGIDIGAKTIKVVIMKDGKVLSQAIGQGGFDQQSATQQLIEDAALEAGIQPHDIQRTVATGVGRNEAPIEAKGVTEVTATARGAQYLNPDVRTVIEVGAEEARGVRCDESGKAIDFVANDRCAAGTGSFIEAMARALEVQLEEMGPLSLQSTETISINAQCAVFAESEVVSLVHSKTEKKDICRAVHDSIASRIISMVRRVGIEEKVALVGGMARNPGFVASIKRSLETDVFVPENPEFVGALGAALLAADDRVFQNQTTPSMPKRVAVSRFPLSRVPEPLKAKNLKSDQEFWRWKESNWRDPSKDWRKARIVTAGIDVGSVSSQCVIMIDGELYAYASRRTGSDSPTSAQRAMDWALEVSDGMKRENIQFLVGTGYGRVNIPLADRALTEIACHARGANFMYGPTVRTLLDMGGQDCKAIRVDDKGKATAFLMNDKCAAGTGRGMEVIADLLAVPIEEVGPLSLTVEQEPEPVSSTCVIFAKSEATALLRQGWPKNKVLAAYCSAMAHRVVLLLQRIGVEEDFAITGGISKNIGVVSRIEKELGIKALIPKYDPQIAGAIGAALFAEALFEKSSK